MKLESFLSKTSKKSAHKGSLKLPLCFIIPEYRNKKIVEKGTKEQKERAWKNVILTEQLRGRRQVTGLLSSMLSMSDMLHRTIYDAQNAESVPGTLVRVEGGKVKGEHQSQRHIIIQETPTNISKKYMSGTPLTQRA